ncbi:ABC transporter permease subunit [Fredinandcohnia humi]
MMNGRLTLSNSEKSTFNMKQGLIQSVAYIATFLVKTIAIYVLSAFLIVCIVFMPDVQYILDPESQNNSVKTIVTWEQSFLQIKQFFSHLVAEGEFGLTASKKPIEGEIERLLPRSGKIIFTSFLLVMFIGVLKGIFDYRHRDRWSRIFGDRLTSVLHSFPDFYFITAMIWIVIYFIKPLDFMLFASEEWYGYILPSLIVALYPITYVAKITHGALSEESTKQYVQVSFSKGFTQKFVTYQHMLVNCFSKILSHVTSVMLLLVSNLFLLELFLDYKGMALRLYTAIPNEKELIIALAWVFMTIVFVTQIIAFFLRNYIDPTVRRES